MDSNKFQFIDDANNFLGNVTGYADKAFGNLQGASQSAVDVATAEVAYGMNQSIEWTRQQAIKGLHHLYTGQLAITKKFSKLANMSITDPLALLEPVLEIVSILCKPYYEAISLMAELTPKVTEFSNNLLKISNYKPPALDVAPTEGLFKLQILPITMGEVISGKPNENKLEKPDITKIKKNAKKTADIKYEDSTAVTASHLNNNSTEVHSPFTFIDPNSMTLDNPEGSAVKREIAKQVTNSIYGADSMSTSQLTKIGDLEQQLLGQVYDNMPITYRLGTLEYQVFGKAQLGPISKRYDDLINGIKEIAKQKRQEAKQEKIDRIVFGDDTEQGVTELNDETLAYFSTHLPFINDTNTGTTTTGFQA